MAGLFASSEWALLSQLCGDNIFFLLEKEKVEQKWSYQNIWSQMGTVSQRIMWHMTVLSVQIPLADGFSL